MNAQDRPQYFARFTLFQMLFVLTIIGIVLAILVPYLAQAREMARRTQCQNNLKQLALAIHNYESAFKNIPAGIQVTPGGNESATTRGANWSWSMFIVPYIEASPYYDILDPKNSNSLSDRMTVENFGGNLRLQPIVADPQGIPSKFPGFDASLEGVLKLQKVGMSAFRCPSDFAAIGQNRYRHGVTDSRSRIVLWPGTSDKFDLGVSNYVAANSSRECYASRAGAANGETITEMPDGVFHAVRPVRMREVRDGLSNVVLLSERTLGSLTPSNDRLQFGREIQPGAATVFGSRGIGNSSIDGSVTNDCADAWGAPDVMFSAWGGINLDDSKQPWRKFQGVSSFHPGGVNIVRVDAAVTFLSNISVSDNIDDYPKLYTDRFDRGQNGTGVKSADDANLWQKLISKADLLNIGIIPD